MKKALVPLIALLIFTATACEQPGSPDFELQQTIDLPLIEEVTYRFLGEGRGAIIDTTSEDFDDLFLVDADGLVSLSSEVDFELGDLDDIIPAIDVDPTEVESEIGLIDVDDFTSSFSSEIGVIESDPENIGEERAELGLFEVELDGDGSADFERVTGLDPAIAPPGTPIVGTPPDDPVIITIVLDVDDFIRAEIESGGLEFVFTNDLGFDISSVTASMLSEYDENTETGTTVGTQLQFSDVNHNTSQTDDIVFSAGDEVQEPLAIQIAVEWDSQLMQDNPGDLKVAVSEKSLQVRSATANISGQALNPATEPLEIDNDNFEYALLDSDPEPGEAYELVLLIQNNTELPITNAGQNAMPSITITNSDGDVIDAPKVFQNLTAPGAANLGFGQEAEVVFNLAGQKLTKILTYELDLGTPGGQGITVSSDQEFVITSSTTSLKFVEAMADIDPQSGIELEDTQDVDGDFTNVEVETGQLILELVNESAIPLRIDQLRIFNASSNPFKAENTGRIFSADSEIGELTDVDIPPNGVPTTVTINLDGVGISNRIAYTGTASSPGTDVAVVVRSTDQINIALDGSIQVREASSILDPQRFTTSGDVEIPEDEFSLDSPDHYVEIATGMLRLGGILNEIDLDLDTLIISFPDILMDPSGSGTYHASDSLWFELTGANRIRRAASDQSAQPVINQPLDGMRIYAPNNKVRYNVVAVTENTRISPPDDQVRTVSSNNTFRARVEIEDLKIKSAVGRVRPRVELINDDEGDDGILDLFNDNEAEITDFEDLRELSERISGLEFKNPSFDLIYDTNLGVRGSIIAAIVGISDSGERVYLSGKQGSDMEVLATDDVAGLSANGAPIDRSDLIKFDIQPASQVGEVVRSQVIRFDTETSNVDKFLSNLPVEIRFVGKVVVNPDDAEGFIVDPVEFATSMAIDIPINLSTAEGTPARVEDVLEADLGDLPGPDDDLRLTEMVLFVTYENGLPFETGFEIEFLDENEQVITTAAGVPIEKVSFSLKGAQVDQTSRFVSSPASDMAEIRLTGAQLDEINRTRNIRLVGELATSRDAVSGEVKLRADDYITLKVATRIRTSIRQD